MRKELDFIEELRQKIAIEVKEAELQIGNEEHEGAWSQLKRTITDFQEAVEEKCSVLKGYGHAKAGLYRLVNNIVNHK